MRDCQQSVSKPHDISVNGLETIFCVDDYHCSVQRPSNPMLQPLQEVDVTMVGDVALFVVAQRERMRVICEVSACVDFSSLR